MGLEERVIQLEQRRGRRGAGEWIHVVASDAGALAGPDGDSYYRAPDGTRWPALPPDVDPARVKAYGGIDPDGV